MLNIILIIIFDPSLAIKDVDFSAAGAVRILLWDGTTLPAGSRERIARWISISISEFLFWG